ncbi:MAG: glycosyltransferase family 9 protein [Candidatus Zipacnadales bacterium]
MAPELRKCVITAVGRLNLGGLLAVLERADVLLSNDMGPPHLAIAWGSRTVSLCGSRHRRRIMNHSQASLGCTRLGSTALPVHTEPICHLMGVQIFAMQRIRWSIVIQNLAELLAVELTLPSPAPLATPRLSRVASALSQ